MLTASHRRVKQAAPLETFGQNSKNRMPDRAVACRVIDQALNRYRPRRTLLLTSDPAELEGISAYPVSSLFTVYCGAASGVGELHSGPALSLECATSALPFQADSFDLVVAHGPLSDGDEELVDEIRRVLQGGAHLLVVGHGHWGSRNLWRSDPEQPAIRPFRICRRLAEQSFVIESCAGYGLARTSLVSGRGLSRPLVAVSDHVLVRARLCKRRPLVNAVRFGRRQTVQAGIQALSASRTATAVVKREFEVAA